MLNLPCFSVTEFDGDFLGFPVDADATRQYDIALVVTFFALLENHLFLREFFESGAFEQLGEG